MPNSPTMPCWSARPPASAPPKAASQHRIVGTPLPRLDLAHKIYGQPCFVHDLELPGMLHGAGAAAAFACSSA